MDSILFDIDPDSVDNVVLLWIGPSFKKSGKDFGTFVSFAPEWEQSLTAIFDSGSGSVVDIGKSNGNPK